jgi:carboxyl-terminal processing protease
MIKSKTLFFAFLFCFCMGLFSLPSSHATVPQYYKEKKIFYDSLSVVLNKYIVPVGNWSLFEGTLLGIQKHVGETRFRLKFINNLVEVSIKDSPPLIFYREGIDTNAIEFIECISKVLDSTFEQFAYMDKTGIIHAAISSMIATLEPNSYFIEPKDLQRLQEQNKGVFGGVGLEITNKDGVATIVTPYENTPAFRQGLKPNDRIIAVDGVSTRGLNIMDVSGRIRGEKGEKVTLAIERDAWGAPRDIVLERETISHRTIKSFHLEPGFGYIRVINFLGTTDDDFTAALDDLVATSQLEGLVIDLRYNPGGLLNQSLGMADFFINNGIIATTEGRIKSDNKTFYARPGTLSCNYPIVIIINEGSASGTEVIASSLRSHERAVLIGEKSFGKGFMQAIFPISTGGAIRLTTSKLMTPEGDEIQNVGIMPDLKIPPALLDYEKSSADGSSRTQTMDSGATKDDPAVKISLEILKRSLLLQEEQTDDSGDLSPEQKTIRKRYNGMKKALEEVALQNQL